METNVWIKQRRIASNLSQRELAEIAGVSQSTIARLERGEHLSTDYYIKVKEALRNYQTQLPRKEYYRTQIMKEAMAIKDGKDDYDTLEELSHLIVHASKLMREIMEDKKKD